MNKTSAVLKTLILLVLLASPLAGIPVQRASAQPAAAQSPNALLQFTAGGHILGFGSDGIYAATGSHALHVEFVGARVVQPQAEAPTSPGGGPAPLNRVQYPDLWPGISLTYDAASGSILRSTYELEAGADASGIRLRYNAPVTLNSDGTLRTTFETGALTESAPLAWQAINGRQVPVAVSFAQYGSEVGFALGQYDASYPLTIDPVLAWNTFLGGTGSDEASAIAPDPSGAGFIYVAGNSNATWGSPVRAYNSPSASDAFVAKLDTSGAVVWSTFVGGSGLDYARGIALSYLGYVYVVGDSTAAWGCVSGNCTERAFTPGLLSGEPDAFVAMLSMYTGGLLHNTFLGGNREDRGTAIASDNNGNVYVVGNSYGTWGTPVQAYLWADAFAAKLDYAVRLQWNTFLGAGSSDFGKAVAVDSAHNSYVAGIWGGTDAFAAKLDATGHLAWNSILGNTSYTDQGYAIALDRSCECGVYVAGKSDASWGKPLRAHYPVVNADAFVARLSVTDGALQWNTFLGGSGGDIGYGLMSDTNGNVFAVGSSDATWGSPTIPYAGSDAFVAEVSATGLFAWNTFLGGSTYEAGYAISPAGNPGNIYVVGRSGGTWGAPVRPYTCCTNDGFVARIQDRIPVSGRSVGAHDGWVLESSETSSAGGTLNATASSFILGDDAQDRQYRSILSFKTYGLPDTAIVTKVTLRVRKISVVGGANPLTALGGFMADTKKGFFYSVVGLQAPDFQAAASKTCGPFTSAAVDNWYTLNLTCARGYINKLTTGGGVTQIRLRFKLDDNNNNVANEMNFYSGDTPFLAYRPELFIEFYVP